MLTFFATPKAFTGHNEIIQRNAIQSWLQLRPACEVILMGVDQGTAEVAHEFGLRHIPDVACNQYGTPRVDAIFERAQAAGSHPLLCYINADIILLSDFLEAVQRITFQQFLIVGRRWDMDIDQPLDFGSAAWESDLRDRMVEEASRHAQWGIDYFVFRRGLWGNMRPFAIGRPIWDNWLVYQAMARGAMVVDASQSVTAVHQNHGYSHVSGGRQVARTGPEAERNRELADGHVLGLHHAPWRLTPQGLSPSRNMIAARFPKVWSILYHLQPRWLAGALYRRARRVFKWVGRR